MELVLPSNSQYYSSAPKHYATYTFGLQHPESAYWPQNPGSSHTATDRLEQLSMANLRQTLPNLVTKQNTLLSIHRLPSEIILQIIHEALSPPSENYLTALTAISSTCLYWRKLAISDPTLWSKVMKPSLPAVQGMLARAGTVPLHVSCMYVGRRHLPALGELMKEVHRIRHLELECGRDATLYSTVSALSGDLYSLQFLSIKTRSVQHGLKLVCNAPNLTSLELFHCSIRERPPFYAQKLRRLVFHSHFREDDRLRLDEWVDLLSSLPLLEELDLRNPLGAESEIRLLDHMVPRSEPTMKSLTQLFLRGEIEELTQFLTYVTYPCETQTLIHVDSMNGAMEPVEDLVRGISEPVLRMLEGRTGHSSPQVLIVGESERDRDIIFDFSPALCCQWPDPNVLRLILDRDTTLEQNGFSLLSGMRSMFTSLGLRTLAVDNNPYAMEIALQHYPNIEHFALIGSRFRYCLDLLAEQSFVDRVQMLGNIRTFSLNGVSLEQDWGCGLVGLFEGTQISKINIQNSTLSEKDLGVIRNRFEMQWDGEGCLVSTWHEY